jgi:formylglycine-generating enzyme required for sulfatase activity
MTFCLADGTLLSAPFDPRASEYLPASRTADPGRTEILHPAPNAVDTTPPPQIDKERRPPPETVASPVRTTSPQQETSLSLTPESASTGDVTPPSALKTIKAPPPELMIGKDQHVGIAVQTLPAKESPPAKELGQTHSKGGKLITLIAGGGLVIVIIGALVWLSQRNHTRTTSPAAAQSLPAKTTENKPPPSGQSFTENVNGVEIRMVSVPGGTFLMGSPLSETGRDQDESPQNEANVPSLRIGKYEVTQAQYRAVIGTNPSSFKGEDLPVDSVSWNDAVEFCNKLSRATGRAYRLPTEAEWEYAARAKTTGPFAGDADAMTWYDANSGNRTHPVGQKEPNGFGLYDMNGNVWEWCQSKYKPYPYRADDGREDLQSTDVRVMRGGSWRSPQKGCRSAYRRRVPPDDRTIGFRIVLAAP